MKHFLTTLVEFVVGAIMFLLVGIVYLLLMRATKDGIAKLLYELGKRA